MITRSHRRLTEAAAGIILISCLALLSPGNEGRLPDPSRDDVRAALDLGPAGTPPEPAGAPLLSCSISRDNCGSISPSPNSVYIADGAYNVADGTLFFVDVPSGSDGVFQVNPSTCEIVSGSYYSVNYGMSQRGIGYDPEYHRIWVGGWNDGFLNQHSADPPYLTVSYTYTGLDIAGIAVSDADDCLFVGTNGYPDMLHVYDITGGTLGELLGSWPIPWQTYSDGYDMAGMGFDDDLGRLVMVNQAAAGPGMTREVFDFDISSGPAGTEHCELSVTDYAWGTAVVEESVSGGGGLLTYHPDISDFDPPFDLDEYGIADIIPPRGLTCWPTEYQSTDLTWTNGEAYDAIQIYRDGCLVTEIPGDETSFTDYYIFTPWIYEVAGVIGNDESGRSECTLTWWGPDVWFYFDTSGDGFTPGGYADWEWGTPGHVISGNAWETNIGRDYFNGACGWLDSPELYLQFGGGLYFMTYDSVQCLHDGWNVQVSTDHGASWSLLVPSEGASYDQGEPLGSCDEGLGGDSNCGDGDIRQWYFNLLDFDNRMVKIRFLFESDEETTAPGVVMDMFGMSGGIRPAVVVSDRLQNPDSDGDGTPDAYLGEYLTYSATFVNQSSDTIDFAEDHLFYAESDCPIPVRECPEHRIGPTCVGTIPPGGTATRHYRVKVPYDATLLDGNPWVIETMARECVDGEVGVWGGRDCFGVTFLPPRHPPPEPLPGSEGFVFEVEEVDRTLR